MKFSFSKKWVALCGVTLLLVPMIVVYQNFSPSPKGTESIKKETSIGDSLSAALEAAEKDHTSRQLAFHVEPGQVEKSLKKQRKLSTVEVPSTINGSDNELTAVSVKPGQPIIEETDIEDAVLPDEEP